MTAMFTKLDIEGRAGGSPVDPFFADVAIPQETQFNRSSILCTCRQLHQVQSDCSHYTTPNETSSQHPRLPTTRRPPPLTNLPLSTHHSPQLAGQHDHEAQSAFGNRTQPKYSRRRGLRTKLARVNKEPIMYRAGVRKCSCETYHGAYWHSLYQHSQGQPI